MRKLIVATLLLCPGGLYAAGYGIEEKVALEKSITDKVQQIAVPYLGTSEILIWTDVTVDLSKTETKSEDTTKPDPTYKMPDLKQEDASMPGVEEEFLSPDLQSKMPDALKIALAGRPIIRSMENSMRLPTATIKSVKIRIIVPKSTPEIDKRIKELQPVLEQVIPISLAKGDALEITPLEYQRDPIERFIYWKDKLGTTILWAFVALMGTIFVFGPVRGFMNRLVGTLENFEIKTTSSVKELIEQKETAQKAMLAGPGGGGPGGQGLLTGPDGKGTDVPFNFVRLDNMTKVLWTLESADAPTIAVVAAHLAPDLSSQLISALDPDKQKEVLLQLSSPQSVDKEIVTQLHTQLKAQVESVVGGVDHILNILDQQTPEKQAALLAELRNDKPEVVEKIEGRLLTIDKIFKLPKTGLQTVIYEAYRQRINIGVILKSLPKELQTAGMAALPETLVQVVTGDMNLPLNPAVLDTERRKFMALIRNMEKAGKVSFAPKAAA